MYRNRVPDVADVGPSAQGIQVARFEERLDLACLDHRDLLGERGFGENAALAGPGAVNIRVTEVLHPEGLRKIASDQVCPGL